MTSDKREGKFYRIAGFSAY